MKIECTKEENAILFTQFVLLKNPLVRLKLVEDTIAISAWKKE